MKTAGNNFPRNNAFASRLVVLHGAGVP
jgi:hypothetical protein